MSEAAVFRQQARDHEQRENWKRAIEAYEKAIQAEKRERRDVDLSLYNRVGDLYRRIGDINRAVGYYEEAADGHLSAGFYNNAIALCNKILRNQPNRHSAYLKLGKIGAAKGFLSDARRHFLEYADRMRRSGQLDEAFTALIDFADLSPDPEVRLMIVDQLLDHDRRADAVEQLRLAWRDLSDQGRDADAQEVRSRIVEMAPDRDPEVDPPEAAASPLIDAEGVIDLPEILPYDEPPEEPARADADVAMEPEDSEEAGVGVEELADLDAGLAEDELEEGGLEVVPEELDITPTSLVGEGELEEEEVAEGVDDPGIVPTTVAGSEEEEREAEGIEPEETVEPTALTAEEEEGEAQPIEVDEGIEPTSLVVEDELELEEVEAEELESEVIGEAADVVRDEVEADLDVAAEIDLEPESAAVAADEEPPVVDRLSELEARLQSEGRRPELLVELADALLENGERERATSYLGEALDLYEKGDRPVEAGRVLDELLRLNVNDVRAYQKRIELALKGGDRRGLIEAYLGLADCLDRTDAGNKARIVYQRVLELDPDNQRAAAALEMLGDDAAPHPAAEPKPRQGVASAQTPSNYVDLGSLILEEKERSKSTRFTVPASDPQDESDVDFGNMLTQFKSMVEDAIEKEDAASHYDLGVAYKEMGLIDEAIAEFQIAARGMDYRLRAIEMLGACFIEKQDYRIALKVLKRALQVPGHSDEDLVGIFYAIGRAHESLTETASALEWYERVMGCDVHFKDVSERVAALRP